MNAGCFLISVVAVLWIATLITADGKWQPPPPGTIRLTAEKANRQPKFKASFRHRAAGSIPECFDARERWPQCQSISDIRNQGACGICWAVAAASVLSDRVCIAELLAGKKPSQIYVSAVNLASCIYDRATSSGMENCESGGSPSDAFRWIATRGFVSGGNYSSNVGCQPYSVKPDGVTKTPLVCTSKCTNPRYKKTFKEDTAYIDSYWVSSLANSGRSQAALDAQVLRTQQDILANGPVVAMMNPYGNLQKWNRTQGAYRGEPNQKEKSAVTTHALRIIGWCKDKNNVKYWKILNSWGASEYTVGMGELWFEMEKNVAEIEEEITAPIVTLPNMCKVKSICDSRITQIIRQDAANLASPVYAFYDDCVIKVSVAKSGQISLVGESQPIEKLFVGGPAGPIVRWAPVAVDPFAGLPGFLPADQKLTIYSTTMSGDCTPVDRSGKFDCTSIGNKAVPQATTVVGSDTWTFYSSDQSTFQRIFRSAQDGTQGSFSIGTKLTKEFTVVDTFLNMDDTSILVCGLDKQEMPACSTMKISTKEVSPAVPLQKIINSCPAKQQ